MARIEKTVFISYRRTDISWALAVYQYLTGQKYDVFFDYTNIPSGDFEQIIVSNIKARAHFVLILTPTALDRTSNEGDWLRREIETAMDEKRNIVPLFFDGFSFSSPSVVEKLTGKMANVSRYNGLDIPSGYFPEAMERLRMRYLNVPLNAVIHPVSTEVRKVIKDEKNAADKALQERKDEIKELVKPAKVRSERSKQFQVRKNTSHPFQNGDGQKSDNKGRNLRLYGIGATLLFFLLISIAGASSLINANHNKQIRDVVVQEVGKIDVELDDITIDNQGDNLHLTLAVIASHQLSYDETAQLQQNIASRLQRTVSIEIKYTLETRLDPVIPSTFTTTPGFTPTLTLTSLLPTAILTYTSVPVTLTATIPPFTPTPELGIGSTMTGKDGMTLLYVPAGEFTMGSEDGNDDEKPVHTVYLDAFWIDQTEVTNAMYAMCVKAGKCKEPSDKSSNTRNNYYGKSEFDDYPVIYVSWNDANTYCSWAERRLPTEAEWEKAARGVNAFTYPWGNTGPNSNLLNFNSNVGDTTEVGSYPDGASPYGALDMAGNVWEWVKDWYDAYPSNTKNDTLFGQKYKVIRGGSWRDYYSGVRSTDRYWHYRSATVTNNIGFRCARSP